MSQPRKYVEAGQWLRGLRTKSGKSVGEVAEGVGLNYGNFISNIESGLKKLPENRVKAYAETLNVEPNTFATEYVQQYSPDLAALLFKDHENDETNN